MNTGLQTGLDDIQIKSFFLRGYQQPCVVLCSSISEKKCAGQPERRLDFCGLLSLLEGFCGFSIPGGPFLFGAIWRPMPRVRHFGH